MKNLIITMMFGFLLFSCQNTKCYEIYDLNAETTIKVDANDGNIFHKRDCTNKPCRTEFVVNHYSDRQEFIGNLIVTKVSCK